MKSLRGRGRRRTVKSEGYKGAGKPKEEASLVQYWLIGTHTSYYTCIYLPDIDTRQAICWEANWWRGKISKDDDREWASHALDYITQPQYILWRTHRLSPAEGRFFVITSQHCWHTNVEFLIHYPNFSIIKKFDGFKLPIHSWQDYILQPFAWVGKNHFDSVLLYTILNIISIYFLMWEWKKMVGALARHLYTIPRAFFHRHIIDKHLRKNKKTFKFF